MAAVQEKAGVEAVRDSGWGASVVWQDKGSVTLRYSSPVSRRDFLLPPRNNRVTRRALHHVARVALCDAPTRPGNPSSRRRSRRLLGPFVGFATVVISAGFLIVSAHAFHLRICFTDSAAPAGVYRLIAAPAGRGDLVAACLPAAIAQTGLTRGYLREGDCPAGAEPVAKQIGALFGDVIELEPDRVSINGICSLTAGPRRRTAEAGSCLMWCGARTASPLARSGCSVSTTRAAGMRATSDRFHSP